MNSVVFNKQLNLFCRKYLVKGNEHLISDPSIFPFEHDQVINKLSEDLLYHEKIAFQVYGENIPLAVLVNTFGVKGVEELLEQGALEFVLWTPLVTYFVDEIPGAFPLQSGILNSMAHCDPEESITLGLEWMSNPLPRRARRSLSRKVEKVYKLPGSNVAKDAVKFGHEGYDADLFAPFGLPKTKELTELNKAERAELCLFSNECMELAILAGFKYNYDHSMRMIALNRTEFQRLQNAQLIRDMTDILFDLEQVPNFTQLINQGIIDQKEIPRLRGHKDSIEFRSWIHQLGNSTDVKEISKQYINSIVKQKGFFETTHGKFLKTISVTAFSGIVGGIIGGELGSAIGVTLSRPVELFVDLGLNLLDAYVFEGLTKGWTPRSYFDNVIRIQLEKKN